MGVGELMSGEPYHAPAVTLAPALGEPHPVPEHVGHS